MITPHDTILNSDRSLTPNTIKCSKCSTFAVAAWPDVPGSKPEPYCQPCLDVAKQRLLVALGIATYR